MKFNNKYDRSEAIDFLKNLFLPEDFISEEDSLVLLGSYNYIKEVTILGKC
jgi:hypothetical protein